MNRFAWVLIAALLLQGCTSRGTMLQAPTEKPVVRRAVQYEQSPCNDSLYVALRSVALEDMTEREYEYFTRKDTQCAEWQAQRDTWQDFDQTVKDDTQTRAAFVILILIGGAMAAALSSAN